MSTVTTLLRDLVGIPSVSGEEKPVADFLQQWFEERGLAVHRSDRNLSVSVGKGRRRLLLNSHLDVVPPGTGWDSDPFVPFVRNDALVGRGSNDAKASVAAMACAMVALLERDLDGQVVFAATCEEERGRNGLERYLPELGAFDAAVVGEPTELQPAVAQNGLLILELTARGRAGHAARPHLADNAISRAARDITALSALRWEPVNVHVGPMTLAVTQVEGGVAHNVIPGACKMVVDIRTIPDIPASEVVERVKATVESEVWVRSDRLAPAHTPAGSAILEAVEVALPGCVPFGSPTMSDWAHLTGIPAVKLGPGLSEVSHTANEWVNLPMVERAVDSYVDIAQHLLSASMSG
jgi:acetylornithine deacetylase